MVTRCELKIIERKMNQLMDVLMHQHHLTRELIKLTTVGLPMFVTTAEWVKESAEHLGNSEVSSLEMMTVS